MPINNLQENFLNGVVAIYDAEHRFLDGQQLMLSNATDLALQQMITHHIEQTHEQIGNLDQVFTILGQSPSRHQNDGATGIVEEGRKLIDETKSVPSVCDTAIAGAAAKVEHYEIASYRGLIGQAQLMGQQDIVRLLDLNLNQEVVTAQMVENSMPTLLQKAAKTALGEMPTDGLSLAQ